jgi:hypothetical protein
MRLKKAGRRSRCMFFCSFHSGDGSGLPGIASSEIYISDEATQCWGVQMARCTLLGRPDRPLPGLTVDLG